MKRIIPIIIMLISGIGTAAASGISARVEEKVFESENVRGPRKILIYVPQEYDLMTQADFDVIYVFDAQWRSSFDLATSLMHYFAQNGLDDPRDYIVVGVPSPQEADYNRNNDFLPVPERITLPDDYIWYGSADGFKKFIKEELMPWVDATYRTSGHTLGIGHSLGASFVLDAMSTDELFDDYIAMSPNFFWDDNRFADNFTSYDFSAIGKPRFIYLTMADEVGADADDWGEAWGNAWRRVKSFVDTVATPQGVVIRTAEFPGYDHNQSVLPALTEALTTYARYRSVAWPQEGTYPVHIELTGDNLDGDIFITGNQPALADWNPEGIKMKSLDDSTKVIDLVVTLPAEFKFTRGSWENQIGVSNAEPGNLRISNPLRTTKTYRAW